MANGKRGNMTVRGTKIRFMEHAMDIGDLHEIFKKFPPDKVLIFGDHVTEEMGMCYELALRRGIPVEVENSSVKAELEAPL